MKLIAGTGYGSRACELTGSKDMTFASSLGQHLEADTVGYAVCHLLRNRPDVADRYVNLSYRLRFSKRYRKNGIFCWLSGPSQVLELPKGYIRVCLRVTASGVSVERVILYPTKEDYEKDAKAG